MTLKPLPASLTDCLSPSPVVRAQVLAETLRDRLDTMPLDLPFVFSPRERFAILHTYIAARLRSKREPRF